MWYKAARVMRKQRQKANQTPRFVASSLGISLSSYREVERGGLRLVGEPLSHWCHLVALGRQPTTGTEIKLTPEEQIRAQALWGAVVKAQGADREARISR